MKSLLNRSRLLCFLLLVVWGTNSKILPSKHLPSKSAKFNERKEHVNNIMLKALTGVLAKKALRGALSSKGKAKLARSDSRERKLVDLKSQVPAKKQHSHSNQGNNFWTKAESNFKSGNRK